jgi:hypothetical protein
MLLPRADWDALMVSLVRQKYQLILGAGASIQAKNRYGTPVMAGDALAEALVKDFNLPRPTPLNLRRVYAAARGHKSTTGRELTRYLQDRYSGCQAPGWYRYLVSIPWKYIWTLNIDDVLENAYFSAFAPQARNRLRSVSWTERHKIPDPDEVVAVHLHGKVERARNPDELIFDISSYLLATGEPHRWHSIFADSYSDTPTIVLGARLNEELDLNTVLERGRLAAGDAPSLIVLKTIDEFDKNEYQRWGLIPIEATAEEFLKAVANDWPKYALEYAPDTAEAKEQVSPRQLAFLQQWNILDPPLPRQPDLRHDFYAGHEPIYSDILEDLDFRRRGFSTLHGKLLQQDQSQLVTCIYGPAFSGKTAVALRLCRSAAEDGWTVYSFDPELRPDLEAIIWWAMRSPKTVLHFEGLADFAYDISTLMQRCITDGVLLHVVAVERESRMKEVRRAFRGSPLYEWSVSTRLNKREAGSLITVLQKHARLGVITGMPRQEQLNYFLANHRGELFSSLSGLEAGQGFLDRVHRRLTDVGRGNARTVIHLAAIVSSMGYDLPFGVAMSTVGISPTELTRIIAADNFSDIVGVRNSRLYPRHRVFGSYLIEHEFSQQENFATTSALARHLAPHISPAAIAARTLQYRLVRQLLDWELLDSWLGTARLLEWYGGIQDLYDWNARYWEQRALAASHIGLHERAMSWARRAIATHRDAYALNTLATVTLRRGMDAHLSHDEQMDFYLEAVSLLEEARATADEDSEYPYSTFFRYTIEHARVQQSRDGTIDAKMTSRWNDWWHYAQDATAFQDPINASLLQRFQRDWLRLAIKSQKTGRPNKRRT